MDGSEIELTVSSTFSFLMKRFIEGDRIRVDIPDETDPDYDDYHRVTGTVVEILEDNAGITTGDIRDSQIYRVELDSGTVEDFRWRDLRPL